jgi:formylglycine-generating enzyme required for sulfatase activity
MIYIKNILRVFLISLLLLQAYVSYSQSIDRIFVSGINGLRTDSVSLTDSTVLVLKREKPLLSFLIDEKLYTTGDVSAILTEDSYSQSFGNKVSLIIRDQNERSDGKGFIAEFENTSADTVTISNVVPFVSDIETVNITGKGPADLARAWLFRPGYNPVRVILPDNAWELGYTSFETDGKYSVCALTRRKLVEGGVRQRYATILPPKAKVTYYMYTGIFKGEWQNGLRLMFRDKYLFDLDKFDNTLYNRPDLAWIRESYLIVLQMAWDREFFDRATGKYTFPDLLRRGIDQFGYIDVYGIWPTWPRLGLDQRNQWDMYGDLPGGTSQLRNFSRLARQNNTRFFIAYNPWDNSTRKEDHYKGMARLIQETEADGVVLDTRGSSSYELQRAADSVRSGVVMYSEGMAVTRDMPGIISGRVHNAIFLSPELNLNKLIKPDFSIFRVCDVGEDLVHREIAISFFNGYGTELNMFRPGGRDDNYRDDMEFLARTTFILRQNNDAFLDREWTPLVETLIDKVYVNEWKSEGKKLYTVLNMNSGGIEGKLIRSDNDSLVHYVSLWNHENISVIRDNGIGYIPVRANGWPASWSGTRKEGSLDCIAAFPSLLYTFIKGDSLYIKSANSRDITIWKGNPSYKTEHKDYKIAKDTLLRIRDLFGYYEGKIVVQLLQDKHLLDENILEFRGGKPWLISRVTITPWATGIAPDMVLIPGNDFSFQVTTSEDFIPYPDVSNNVTRIDSFLIDKYPVTNAQYYEFLQSSGYRPADTARYLRHWERGIYRQGQERYPVVYISYEDAAAYAKWAGKRLPTQSEWQLAAQGTDKRLWPWGEEFHGTLCNNAFDKPTPVDAFPKGASPYGVMDLVGNVWQMTNDMYFNGSNYFIVIRGGSFYKPDSSWWYIQGGPQPLDRTQIMLLVAPGFDRNATVGFRCVKDIDKKNFRSRK